MAKLLAVPPWSNQKIVLYHGTLDVYAAAICSGVNVELGRARADFGQGFYMTTIEGQARRWAQLLVRRSALVPRPNAAVIRFVLRRDDLAKLEALWFVRATKRGGGLLEPGRTLPIGGHCPRANEERRLV